MLSSQHTLTMKRSEIADFMKIYQMFVGLRENAVAFLGFRGYNEHKRSVAPMPEINRAVKDSVFTYLFRQPEYTRRL